MNGRGTPNRQPVEASIDWLTITYRDKHARQEAYGMASRRMQKLEYAGHEQKQWSAYGFNGVSVGGVSWGEREDCDMVRLSGGSAGEDWKEFYKLGGNPTRLDAAITIRLPQPKPLYASGEYRRIAVPMDTHEGRRGYSIIESTGGGNTLYVGSRSSRWYGRLYDKGVESGTAQAGSIWRYEVEAKEDAAKSLASNIARAKDPAREISGFVYDWFTSRGVNALWKPDTAPSSIVIIQNESSTATKLAWLRRQVKPTIEWLRERGEHLNTLDALGLDDSSTTVYNDHQRSRSF